MIEGKTPRLLLLGLALLVLEVGGCKSADQASKDESSEGDDEPKKKKKSKKDDEPAVDPELVKKAEELAGKVKNGRLPSDVTKDQENAAAVLHLAKSAKEAETAAAALLALDFMYTASDKLKDKTLAGPEYHAVVLERLGSDEPKVQAAALRAAGHSIGGATTDAKVIAKVIELAAKHPKPEGRMAAIDRLTSLRELSKNDAAMAAMVAAIDAKETWLVSTALWRLSSYIGGYAKKAEVEPKVVALLSHSDPGIRGRAAQCLASIASFDKAKGAEVAAKVLPMLDDPDPWVKSAAMSSLASVSHLPAIHEIVKHLDDDTKNTYEIKGFTNLDGSSGWVHHDGSAWSRVNDAALWALQRMSGLTKERFSYKIDHKKVDEDLKRAAGEAKAWYAKVKADIPTK